MFETTFSHASAQSLPPDTSPNDAIRLLHDFDTVMHLSPDCKNTTPMEPKNGMAKSAIPGQQFFEVEDSIPFIPKRLWSGGVSYTAAFLRVDGGCDITVYAPGGFTSVNHWRIVRNTSPGATQELEKVPSRQVLEGGAGGDSEWRVEIVSDAKCSRTFAGFVRGFLKNAHQQQETAFVQRLQESKTGQENARPGVMRRRSSWPMQ